MHSWVLESTKGEVGYQKFFDLATKITNSLEFMSAAGVNSENSDSLRKVDFFDYIILLKILFIKDFIR